MAQFKGTKEKVINDPNSPYHSIHFTNGTSKGIFFNTHDRDLFTDALHTIQECDLLPSQLLEKVNDGIGRENELHQLINQLREENAKLKEALKDKDFIISALNSYWYEARLTFSRETSGDIERDQAKKQMNKAKTLMNQLELLNS